jgi:hypothetical protein
MPVFTSLRACLKPTETCCHVAGVLSFVSRELFLDHLPSVRPILSSQLTIPTEVRFTPNHYVVLYV